MTRTDSKLVKHTVQQLLELQHGKLWMGDEYSTQGN